MSTYRFEYDIHNCIDTKIIKSHLNKPIIFDGKNQYDKYDMLKRGFEYYQIGVRSL